LYYAWGPEWIYVVAIPVVWGLKEDLKNGVSGYFQTEGAV